MKHRHLSHEDFTLAAIDDIIERGSIPDWAPLIEAIKADPYGEVAGKTLTVCENHEVYGGTKYFRELVQDMRAEADARAKATSFWGLVGKKTP